MKNTNYSGAGAWEIHLLSTCIFFLFLWSVLFRQGRWLVLVVCGMWMDGGVYVSLLLALPSDCSYGFFTLGGIWEELACSGVSAAL
jgi:hypothetical protein